MSNKNGSKWVSYFGIAAAVVGVVYWYGALNEKVVRIGIDVAEIKAEIKELRKEIYKMTAFDTAVEFVIQNEGFYSKDPYDHGFPTKYGISQRFLKYHYPGTKVEDLTLEDAKAFIHTHFWDKDDRFRLLGYDHINSPLVRRKLLDMAVQFGPLRAHKLAQEAINMISDHNVIIDGIFGPSTLKALNSIDEELMYNALRAQSWAEYKSINHDKFIKGWQRRALR